MQKTTILLRKSMFFITSLVLAYVCGEGGQVMGRRRVA